MKEDILKHELETTMTLVNAIFDDIQTGYDDFIDEPTINGAYKLRTLLSKWVDKKDKYDWLRNLYQHGWGQEDTKHE
jgi:hypothetical protein